MSILKTQEEAKGMRNQRKFELGSAVIPVGEERDED